MTTETVEAVSVLPDPPRARLTDEQCQGLLNDYVRARVGSLFPDETLADLKEEARLTLAEANEARDQLAEAQAVAQRGLTGDETEEEFAAASTAREAARTRVEFLSARAEKLARSAILAANALEGAWTQRRRSWEARYEVARKELQAFVASEVARARNLEVVVRLMPRSMTGHSNLRLCPLPPSSYVAQRLLEEVTNHG
jgi:hypothetical protein